MLRRKNLRVLRFKQRGFAPGPGQFLDLQFFQPLVFLEPHLEPAGEGHEHAETEENRAGLPRQRIHVGRHDEGGDENHHGRDQVHQTIFLNVAFHRNK